MRKMRRFDFTVEEMLEKTGLNRKQFTDALNRFCDMYNFEKTDFKIDRLNPNSDYFFPPEVAEPLAIMLKNLRKHPLFRRNASTEKITASALTDYDRAMLNDIETQLPDCFKYGIHNLRGHLVSQRIVDWSAPFVRELTRFVINLTTLKEEDIGATLQSFTKTLSQMNYYLHRGSYVSKLVGEKNRAWRKKVDSIGEEKLPEKLHEQNINIDVLLTELIRLAMQDAHAKRDSDNLFELKDLIARENALLRMMGVRKSICTEDGKELFKDVLNPTDEQQREGYYSFVYGDIEPNPICEKVLTTAKEGIKKWKPIDKQIEESIFAGQTIAEQYRWNLENEISELKNALKRKEDELEAFKNTGEVPTIHLFEDDAMLIERLKAYVEHCHILDADKELYDIVDSFVGRALYAFLK